MGVEKSFDRQCIECMARKDLFATMLFIMKAPKHQQRTLKKWALEAIGIKERDENGSG